MRKVKTLGTSLCRMLKLFTYDMRKVENSVHITVQNVETFHISLTGKFCIPEKVKKILIYTYTYS